MSRILLFFCTLLFSFTTIGQNSSGVQNITTYTRNGLQDDWQNNVTVDYQYDENGNLTQQLRRRWSGLGWVNQIKLGRTYNDMGQMVLYTYQNWNTQNNSWENYSQTTYTYNAFGKMIENIRETWDTDHWKNSTKGTYSYDDNGYMSELLHQSWNSATSTWRNTYLYTFVNNSNGLVTDYLYQNWTAETWVNSIRETRTYTPENNLANVLQQTWPAGSWVNFTNTTYTYDANHYLIEKKSQDWESSLWSDYERYLYTNNNDGTVSEVIGSTWDYPVNDFWFDSIKEVYTYNSLATTENTAPQIEIFPNPANNAINIKTSNQQSVSNIRMVDTQGRMIPITHANSETIDVSRLSNGIYLLQFEVDGKPVSKKFLKN